MNKLVIPAILVFIVGLALWAMKRKRLALEYDIVESDPFPRAGGTGKYFVCNLRNSGNCAIENISLNIKMPDGELDAVKYSNSQLIDIIEESGNLIQGGFIYNSHNHT